MLMAGDLDMGHARALLALEKATQITAANQIAAKKMSVREAESLAKKLGAEFNLVSPKPKKEKSRDLKRVEEELSDLLTAEVEVRVKKARQAPRPGRRNGRAGHPVRLAGRAQWPDRKAAGLTGADNTFRVIQGRTARPFFGCSALHLRPPMMGTHRNTHAATGPR
jgi:hypothetical protein